MDAQERSHLALQQEREGQTQLVNLPILPSVMDPDGAKEYLESLGVIFVALTDDLMFWYVWLPDGWEVAPSFNPMLSVLLDDQGRERARIFYKASWYDRHAWLALISRYNLRETYGEEIIRKNTSAYTMERMIADGGCVLLASGTDICTLRAEVPEGMDRKERHQIHKRLLQEAYELLEVCYPKYRDPFAYWD